MRTPIIIVALGAAALAAAPARHAAADSQAGAVAGAAEAEAGTDASTDAEAGGEGEARLTVPKGRVVVHALVELSLSADAAFAPVSVAPDVWYGATPALTVGLVHSSRALTGFLGGTGGVGVIGGAGDGLCLTGTDGGCARVYDQVGMVARYHLLAGKVTVALDGGLLARSFDPFAVSVKVGFAARWQRGKLAVEAAPNLWIGMSARERGNGEMIDLPVGVTYAIRPRLALAAQTGLIAPTDHFRREVVIALSAGAQLMATDQIFVDVVFSLPHWLDTDLKTYGLDARTLTIGAGRAF